MMTCIFVKGRDWIINEIKSHKNYNFYLSGVMIEKINGHINYNFGDDL